MIKDMLHSIFVFIGIIIQSVFLAIYNGQKTCTSNCHCAEKNKNCYLGKCLNKDDFWIKNLGLLYIGLGFFIVGFIIFSLSKEKNKIFFAIITIIYIILMIATIINFSAVSGETRKGTSNERLAVIKKYMLQLEKEKAKIK
tara:strand:+ start:119 stop:541 length:423 start_codon:yes stop_codon:yes gene_type:complete